MAIEGDGAMAKTCGKEIEIGKGETYLVCDLPAGHGGHIHSTDGQKWRDPEVPYVPHDPAND